MKITMLRDSLRQMFGTIPAFGLCFTLVMLCADAQVVAGQDTAAQQPEFLEEARRLDAQILDLKFEGKFDAAIPLAERLLAIREKALGPYHQDVVRALDQVASLYMGLGDYAKAETLLQRVLTIKERTHGREHPKVAEALNSLAALYLLHMGEPAKAESLQRRVLAIMEKAHGPEHPKVTEALYYLALLYLMKGDHAKAEPLQRRVLAILENAHGPEDDAVANALSNLAHLYKSVGDHAKAEPLFRREVAIREKRLAAAEKRLGPEHMNVVSALKGLTSLYRNLGDYAKEESLLQRILAIEEKTAAEFERFGHQIGVANALDSLAEFYRERGELAKAEPLYQRALALMEKELGPDHPWLANSLNRFAVMVDRKGDPARAVKFLSRANEVMERNLARILDTGSERQKFAYLATLSGNTDNTVSLHARSAPSDPQALQLALTTILRRKGRALDAMSDQVASLRKRLNPQDRALLDQLSAAQSKLSGLVLGGPGRTSPAEYRAAVSGLETEVERLQDAVSRSSTKFRAQKQPVTVEAVQKAIPAGSALVEFFSYRPLNFKAKTVPEMYGAPHYVAYVLRREGEPLWVDLGESASVDADIAQLLTALKCPQTGKGIKGCPAIAEVKRLARAVDERVMRPVRKRLGDTRQVFISPDGALNLIPFSALVDENNKYLVESYSLTYLTSGRDLLRLQVGSDSRQPPLVVANPAFGDMSRTSSVTTTTAPIPTPERRVEETQAKRSGDMGGMQFAPLQGTADEAKALGPMLTGVRMLTQGEATETALKGVSAPRVLHIATHGFFLPDRPQEATEGGGRGIELGGGAAAQAPARIENPLLRSGLALEGANSRRGAGGEDGILTALEVAGLDLWGTKLVVLSACETGVGDVKNGEGVYGLRRALVLAGSESQVMSLWQVSDDATRDLMVSYYKRLMADEGRTEALRQVQLAMLGGSLHGDDALKMLRNDKAGQREEGQASAGPTDYSHPYYWAAFIQSGEWRGMGHRAQLR